ncbi:WSD1 family O-acyltransferase [Massilia terrae]|uniref:diacylglycerol O-acyltransferase n=1 Tax=Massilia terrae TaxID=1811224 RepID=A0ABT2CS33_9BURK|nr:WSD1 family O-acyltransferase [Massilia terrae]MCS0656756.1 wax ester/triacylglycerol synthase family O-acyltransferase [Massilia terrae]
MSVVDIAWLRMDRPTNLMMICGMMMFEHRVDIDRLRDVIAARMLCFHRFLQRVGGPAESPCWEPDPHFELDWHVQLVALRPGRDALEELLGDLVSTALDPHKPMWQFHLAQRANASALILRIHHCYGDGFALLHVVDAITDLDPAHPHAAQGDLVPAPRRTSWERILGVVAETAGDALRATLDLADTGSALLASPRRTAAAAASAVDLLYQAGVIAAMMPDANTSLKGELGVTKRVAWAAPLALDEVKAVCRVFGCSVNDLLVACLAGVLRAWLQDRGEQVDGLELRALVPVNLRPPGPVHDLGNRFGMVFLDLPVGIENPVQRVAEVKRRMSDLKRSQQPLVALGILAAMGLASESLKERLLETLAANASIIVTNVHGADQARYLAGQRIARQMFWVPQSGGIGLGVSILSYAGQISPK